MEIESKFTFYWCNLKALTDCVWYYDYSVVWWSRAYL